MKQLKNCCLLANLINEQKYSITVHQCRNRLPRENQQACQAKSETKQQTTEVSSYMKAKRLSLKNIWRTET